MKRREEKADHVEDRYESLLSAMQHILSSKRIAAGHTQASMATALGKSQPAVNKAENASPNVSLRILFEFANELGLNLSDILLEAERQSGISGGSDKNRTALEFSPDQLQLVRKAFLSSQKQAVDTTIQKLSSLNGKEVGDK